MTFEQLMNWFDVFYAEFVESKIEILGHKISHAYIEIHTEEEIDIVLVVVSPTEERTMLVELPTSRVEKIIAGEDQIYPYEFAWIDEVIEENMKNRKNF